MHHHKLGFCYLSVSAETPSVHTAFFNQSTKIQQTPMTTATIGNSTPTGNTYTKIQVRWENENQIARVVLNDPRRLNAMTPEMFDEICHCFGHYLNKQSDLRVVTLQAEGRMFTSGLDLSKAMGILQGRHDNDGDDQNQEIWPARSAIKLHKFIQRLQQSLDAIARCKVPVISCIHGTCIGAGMDMMLACDMRLATSDCTFSIRETKVAIVADLGTLQRIVKLTGNMGLAKEMAFSGGDYTAQRMADAGLLNQVLESQQQMMAHADRLAKVICGNSPLVVQATKHMMDFALDHTIADGLEHVALWNAAFLRSEDLQEAVMAFMQKRQPKFKNKL